MDKYDPNAVIQAANDKLSNGGDIDGGSMVFQTALLEWTDDVREGVPNGVDVETLTEAIATLWLAYAQFYANHKQYKSATEAYEQAVADPVTRHVGRVWLEYARFLEERNKIKSAQDVYIKVLVEDTQAVDEQDQALLWSEFLEMMQKANPELTLQELQQAVAKERTRARPEPVASEALEDCPPSAKRPRVDIAMTHQQQQQHHESKTYVVTPESVAKEAAAFGSILLERTLPPEVRAGWIIRDGNGPAHRPEPALFGPSPPKLADATAKDILGAILSLQLISRLLGPSGSVLLNVCQGLWTLQALKEKELKAAIDMLDETMTREYEQLEATLDARLAVAGDAASAVQQLNSTERDNFRSVCTHRRQNEMANAAWEFRQLLCLQQQVMSKLDVPGFDGPTVDTSALEQQAKICSFLHSAFFLRNRIGESAHVGTLQKQAARLQTEIQQNSSPMPPGQQQHPMPPTTQSEGYNIYNPSAAAPGMLQPQQMPFQQMQMQQTMMQGGMQPVYGYPQHGQHHHQQQQQLPHMVPSHQQQMQQQEQFANMQMYYQQQP